MRSYYVYILSSKTGTLYVGVTNNLERRVYEHKSKLVPGFTSKYNVDQLVFYEEFQTLLMQLRQKKELRNGAE